MALPPEAIENSGLMVHVLEGDESIKLSGYVQVLDKSEELSSIKGLTLVE